MSINKVYFRMNSKVKQKIVSALAMGALMLSLGAPGAFASGNVNVSGNGAFSHNFVSLSQRSVNTLQQSNNSNILNNVTSNANTGGNSSSFNTGGNTLINTGSAVSNVDISNMAGMNIATMLPCGCLTSAPSVNLSGNGAFSQNTAVLNSSNANQLSQQNNSQVNNNVNSNVNTGNNDSSFNTGHSNMINWNNMFSNFLTGSGWVWNGNSWTWNNSSNNFPTWWNNWFTGNGWNWSGNGWNWNTNGNNGSTITTGSATSNVSIHNATGVNIAH